MADSLGVKFLETSAKDAVNVEKAFTTLSNEIKSKVQSRPGPGGNAKKPSEGGSSGTVLKPKPNEKEKKSGCC